MSFVLRAVMSNSMGNELSLDNFSEDSVLGDRKMRSITTANAETTSNHKSNCTYHTKNTTTSGWTKESTPFVGTVNHHHAKD